MWLSINDSGDTNWMHLLRSIGKSASEKKKKKDVSDSPRIIFPCSTLSE